MSCPDHLTILSGSGVRRRASWTMSSMLIQTVPYYSQTKPRSSINMMASSSSLHQHAITVHFTLELRASCPTTKHGFEQTLLDEVVGFPNYIVFLIALIPMD
jgi:hypothetical protein